MIEYREELKAKIMEASRKCQKPIWRDEIWVYLWSQQCLKQSVSQQVGSSMPL